MDGEYYAAGSNCKMDSWTRTVTRVNDYRFEEVQYQAGSR